MGRSTNTIRTDRAREFRIKYGKEMPIRKLARILYDENQLLYKDYEAARSALRYIEGKYGTHARKAIKSDDPHLMTERRSETPYKFPESDAEDFIPYVMPFHKTVFIMNDIHLPYHDIPALTAAFDYGLHHKPDAVFINGDVLDFHQLSYFEKDPTKKKFKEELIVFEQFMQLLNDHFKCKVYYKFGNHEERYDKFIMEKAKELKGVEEFELEAIIKKRADCEVIRDKRIVVNNGLPYIHGHEYGRGAFSPVNAARGLFLQTKHSAVKGDCHTTSEHTEPDIFGKIMTTYSIGALCGLTPKWLPLNKWNHGCGTQFNTAEGIYSLENKRIYKGKVL